MRPSIIPLLLLSCSFASCKKSENAIDHGRQDEQLEVFRREAAPARSTLSQAPPSWLGALPSCPTSVLPKRFEEPEFSLEDCAGDKLAQCLLRCKASDASACYSAALLLQADTPVDDQPLSTPLFARACELGNASACTNWGATLDETDAGQRECLRNTYEATCRRGQDPWGCTMYARMLVDDGINESTLGAIQGFAPIACRYADDDPACQAMAEVLQVAMLRSAAAQDAAPQ